MGKLKQHRQKIKKYHGKDTLLLVRHLEVPFITFFSSYIYFDVHRAYFYLISLSKKDKSDHSRHIWFFKSSERIYLHSKGYKFNFFSTFFKKITWYQLEFLYCWADLWYCNTALKIWKQRSSISKCSIKSTIKMYIYNPKSMISSWRITKLIAVISMILVVPYCTY